MSLRCKQNSAVNFSRSGAASYLTCRKTTGRVQSTQKPRNGILGSKQQIFEQWRKVVEKERWGEVAVACSCQALSSAEHPSPPCRCKIQEAAAVLFRILWKFFPPRFFLLPCVCVHDFKLYLFFMSICTFKDLLQEYLKGQEHLQGGVVSTAPLKKILKIPRHYIQESEEKWIIL